MKHTFYTIGEKFKLQPEDLSSQIAEEIGHDWLEFSTYSEAERMWNDGHPAFFDMETLKELKRLRGVAQ